MECFMIHHTGYQQQKSNQIKDGCDSALHMISLNNQFSYNPGVIGDKGEEIDSALLT